LSPAVQVTNPSTRFGVSLTFPPADWESRWQTTSSAPAHEVVCFKGEIASYSGPLEAAPQEAFSTNDDLACRLEDLGCSQRFDAVFHAAALCDYQVGSISGSDGQAVHAPKIATQTGSLNLRLLPATKVLPQLRNWFPEARIAGWKYELSGTSTDAFAKAWRQICECGRMAAS
jgi:phosphopantothenoylcysteine decarboxylase/phosphopantothenate--cysteine ligase